MKLPSSIRKGAYSPFQASRQRVRIICCCIPLVFWSLLPLIGAETQPASGPSHFSTPQEAVSVAAELLKKGDWPTLTRYYDLAGTGIDEKNLISGAFFQRSVRPSGAHPGLPWKFREPFTPGFLFHHLEEVPGSDVVCVWVAIEIDQGGGPKQRGLSSFHMRKSSSGYRFVPEVSEFQFSWKDYDGTGDAGKARFILNEEELGTGTEGIKTLMNRISTMASGTKILVFPYYGEPGGDRKYPFDIVELEGFARRQGIRFLLPQAK